jgi:hypothetical protein
MKKRLMASVAVVFFLAVAKLGAESALDFTLVNKTGYGISEVFIGPTSSEDWGDNILEEELQDGGRLSVTFHHKAAKVAKWDLMITFSDDDSKVYWRGYKLSEISKITLHYNRSTDKTTAVTE